MADSPFQEIAARIECEAACASGIGPSYDCDCSALELRATLDRYAEVLATLPDAPSTTMPWSRYQNFCTEFVARLRALSSPLTETTDT